jgi:hypothetical protein
MGRLSIRLPQTLHRELTNEAGVEGVSLNQYIVYLLARREDGRYPIEPFPALEVAQHPERFVTLLEPLGPAISKEEALERLKTLGEDAEVSDREKLAVAAARRLMRRREK